MSGLPMIFENTADHARVAKRDELMQVIRETTASGIPAGFLNVLWAPATKGQRANDYWLYGSGAVQPVDYPPEFAFVEPDEQHYEVAQMFPFGLTFIVEEYERYDQFKCALQRGVVGTAQNLIATCAHWRIEGEKTVICIQRSISVTCDHTAGIFFCVIHGSVGNYRKQAPAIPAAPAVPLPQ